MQKEFRTPSNVVEIEPTDEPHPVVFGATRFQIFRWSLKERLCLLLDFLHVPGLVHSVEIHDELTGQHITIQTRHLFTRISINGRDYYFSRLSGRFDGTGSGCS